MSTEKALTTPVDTATGIVALIERLGRDRDRAADADSGIWRMLSDYQNRLLDMWEAAMQAGIPADAKGHIEWLLSVEFDGLDGQTSCKNCGRHLRIIGNPHVLGTLCSDKCGHENREHYA